MAGVLSELPGWGVDGPSRARGYFGATRTTALRRWCRLGLVCNRRLFLGPIVCLRLVFAELLEFPAGEAAKTSQPERMKRRTAIPTRRAAAGCGAEPREGKP